MRKQSPWKSLASACFPQPVKIWLVRCDRAQVYTSLPLRADHHRPVSPSRCHTVIRTTEASAQLKANMSAPSQHRQPRDHQPSDCIVRVVRLSSCEHQRQRQHHHHCHITPCRCTTPRHEAQNVDPERGPIDKRLTTGSARQTDVAPPHTHSAPSSASASTSHFRSQDHAVISLKHSESKHPRASAPCRSKRGRGELDSIADTRRESAPSTLGGGASSASADTQAQCRGCCASDATSRQEEWAKVYYVRKDVVASQSDLFRELVQAQQVGSGEIGSRAARMIEVALTLPDATSFGVLLDYFESGDFGRISSAMESGEARWESVMLNARHLRVSEVLKMQLGAWWRHQQGRMHRGSLPASAVPPPHATQAHISEPSSSRHGQTGARPRAYTTGNGGRPSLHDRLSESKRILTPSRALVVASPSKTSPEPTHTAKRTREGRIRSTPRRDSRPESLYSVVRAEPRARSPPPMRKARPAALQATLSKRPRALSSLAYYCSVAPESKMPPTLTR